MPIAHKVKKGECISSIARDYGIMPDAIWEDSSNAELKSTRKNQNVLRAGDIVVIPDRERKEEAASTEQRHKFCRKRKKERLLVQIKEAGEPVANAAFVIDVDGNLDKGTTDSDGLVDWPIESDAKNAKITFGEFGLEYDFTLGALDPIDSITGLKQRLENLGYDCGEVNGNLDEETRMAVAQFQEHNDLEPTGETDQNTLDALEREHGL